MSIDEPWLVNLYCTSFPPCVFGFLGPTLPSIVTCAVRAAPENAGPEHHPADEQLWPPPTLNTTPSVSPAAPSGPQGTGGGGGGAAQWLGSGSPTQGVHTP